MFKCVLLTDLGRSGVTGARAVLRVVQELKNERATVLVQLLAENHARGTLSI